MRDVTPEDKRDSIRKSPYITGSIIPLNDWNYMMARLTIWDFVHKDNSLNTRVMKENLYPEASGECVLPGSFKPTSESTLRSFDRVMNKYTISKEAFYSEFNRQVMSNLRITT